MGTNQAFRLASRHGPRAGRFGLRLLQLARSAAVGSRRPSRSRPLGGRPDRSPAALGHRYAGGRDHSVHRSTASATRRGKAGGTARIAAGVRGAAMGHGAEAGGDAIAAAITTLPVQLRRSLTWDQGAEMVRHADLRVHHGLPVHFCDPHSLLSADLRSKSSARQCLAVRHEREHQRTSAAILPQGRGPRRAWAGRTRCRCRGAQRQTAHDAGMENARRGPEIAADKTQSASVAATGCDRPVHTLGLWKPLPSRRHPSLHRDRGQRPPQRDVRELRRYARVRVARPPPLRDEGRSAGRRLPLHRRLLRSFVPPLDHPLSVARRVPGHAPIKPCHDGHFQTRVLSVKAGQLRLHGKPHGRNFVRGRTGRPR